MIFTFNGLFLLALALPVILVCYADYLFFFAHGDTIDSPSPTPSLLAPWRLNPRNESKMPIFDFWAAT
jgi:hypothetical protein